MRLFWLLFGFNGRIGRLSFWFGGLAVSMAWLVFMTVFLAAARASSPAGQIDPAAISELRPYTILPLLLLGVSNLALTTKRAHDRDKSMVWLLVGLVPLVGPLWVLIETGVLAGTPGPNRYGASSWSFADLGHEGRDPDEIVRHWQEKNEERIGRDARERITAAAASSRAETGSWRPEGTERFGRATFGRRGLT